MSRQQQIDLATHAYHAGYADDWPGAARWIAKLNTAHGRDGLITAMLAWIDTAIAASGLGAGDGPVRVAWKAVETGAVQTDADEVPVEARWAGRLFAARLADDEPAFVALLNALAVHTPAQVGDHVMALLRSSVLTVRQGPQSGRLPGGSDG